MDIDVFPFREGDNSLKVEIYDGYSETATWTRSTSGGGTGGGDGGPVNPPATLGELVVPTPENERTMRYASYKVKVDDVEETHPTVYFRERPDNPPPPMSHTRWNWWYLGAQNPESGTRAKYYDPETYGQPSAISKTRGIKDVKSYIAFCDGVDASGNPINLRYTDLHHAWFRPPLGQYWCFVDHVYSRLENKPAEVFVSSVYVGVSPNHSGTFVEGDVILTPVPSILGNELTCTVVNKPQESGIAQSSHYEYRCQTAGGWTEWTRLDGYSSPGDRPLITPSDWSAGKDIEFRFVNKDDGHGPSYVYKNAPVGTVGDPVVIIRLEASNGHEVRETLPCPAVFVATLYPQGFGELDYRHKLFPVVTFGDPGTFKTFPATYLWGNDHNTMRGTFVLTHAYRDPGTYTIEAEIHHPLHGRSGIGTKVVNTIPATEHFGSIRVVDPDGDYSGFPANQGQFRTLEEAARSFNGEQDGLILVRTLKEHVGVLRRPDVTRDCMYLGWGEGKVQLLQDTSGMDTTEFSHDTEGYRMISGFKYDGDYSADFDPANGIPRKPVNFARFYGTNCYGSWVHNCDIKGFSKGAYWSNFVGMAGFIDVISRGGHDFPAFAGDAQKWLFHGCHMQQTPLAWLGGAGEDDWPGNPFAFHDAVRASRIQSYALFYKTSIASIGNWSDNRQPQNDWRLGRSGNHGAEVFMVECISQGGPPNIMYTNDGQAELPAVDVVVDSMLVMPSSHPRFMMTVRAGMMTFRNLLLIIPNTPKQAPSPMWAYFGMWTPQVNWADRNRPVRVMCTSFVDRRRGGNRYGQTTLLNYGPDQPVGEYNLIAQFRNNAIIGEEIDNLPVDTGFDLDTPEFESWYPGRRQIQEIPSGSGNYTYGELETNRAVPDTPLFTPQPGSSVIGDADTSDWEFAPIWDMWGNWRPENMSRGAVEPGSRAPKFNN